MKSIESREDKADVIRHFFLSAYDGFTRSIPLMIDPFRASEHWNSTRALALSLCCSRRHDLSSTAYPGAFWNFSDVRKVPAEFTCHRLSTRRREMHYTRVRHRATTVQRILNSRVSSVSQTLTLRNPRRNPCGVPLCEIRPFAPSHDSRIKYFVAILNETAGSPWAQWEIQLKKIHIMKV